MRPKTGSLAQPRAYVERVLMSLNGDLPPLPDVRAATELEDALTALDRAGYHVQGRSPRRGSLRMITDELTNAISHLVEIERRYAPQQLAVAGVHVETALAHLRWRIHAPQSPVVQRVIDVAAVAASSARPLAQKILGLGDDLPTGPAASDAERRRAVETAFASATRWVPLAANAAGEAAVGESLRGLQHSQANYLAEFLREQEGAFPDVVREAVADAASALDATVELVRLPGVDHSVAVAQQAAQVMRKMVELRSPAVVDEIRWLVDVVGDWPLNLPVRDLS